jgi:hypothetical protein
LKRWEPKHNKFGTYSQEKNGTYYHAKKEGKATIFQCFQQENSKGAREWLQLSNP